jgi:hypothetical protein
MRFHSVSGAAVVLMFAVGCQDPIAPTKPDVSAPSQSVLQTGKLSDRITVLASGRIRITADSNFVE